VSKIQIFSLDVAIKNTAIAFFGNPDVVSASFPTDPCMDAPHRIIEIVDGIVGFMKEFSCSGKHKKVMFIEDFAYGSDNAIRAAQVTGAIKYMICKEYGDKLVFVYIAPPTLKKFIANDGRADKIGMALHAYEKWGKKFPNSDECDAYCLARFGYSFCFGGNHVKREMECLKRVFKGPYNGPAKGLCFYREEFSSVK
jgi:Holliday junction resolvasome RuvABC endonuclease subunit